MGLGQQCLRGLKLEEPVKKTNFQGATRQIPIVQLTKMGISQARDDLFEKFEVLGDPWGQGSITEQTIVTINCFQMCEMTFNPKKCQFWDPSDDFKSI